MHYYYSHCGNKSWMLANNAFCMIAVVVGVAVILCPTASAAPAKGNNNCGGDGSACSAGGCNNNGEGGFFDMIRRFRNQNLIPISEKVCENDKIPKAAKAKLCKLVEEMDNTLHGVLVYKDDPAKQKQIGSSIAHVNKLVKEYLEGQREEVEQQLGTTRVGEIWEKVQALMGEENNNGTEEMLKKLSEHLDALNEQKVMLLKEMVDTKAIADPNVLNGLRKYLKELEKRKQEELKEKKNATKKGKKANNDAALALLDVRVAKHSRMLALVYEFMLVTEQLNMAILKQQLESSGCQQQMLTKQQEHAVNGGGEEAIGGTGVVQQTQQERTKRSIDEKSRYEFHTAYKGACDSSVGPLEFATSFFSIYFQNIAGFMYNILYDFSVLCGARCADCTLGTCLCCPIVTGCDVACCALMPVACAIDTVGCGVVTAFKCCFGRS